MMKLLKYKMDAKWEKINIRKEEQALAVLKWWNLIMNIFTE